MYAPHTTQAGGYATLALASSTFGVRPGRARRVRPAIAPFSNRRHRSRFASRQELVLTMEGKVRPRISSDLRPWLVEESCAQIARRPVRRAIDPSGGSGSLYRISASLSGT